MLSQPNKAVFFFPLWALDPDWSTACASKQFPYVTVSAAYRCLEPSTVHDGAFTALPMTIIRKEETSFYFEKALSRPNIMGEEALLSYIK